MTFSLRKASKLAQLPGLKKKKIYIFFLQREYKYECMSGFFWQIGNLWYYKFFYVYFNFAPTINHP